MANLQEFMDNFNYVQLLFLTSESNLFYTLKIKFKERKKGRKSKPQASSKLQQKKFLSTLIQVDLRLQADKMDHSKYWPSERLYLQEHCSH